MSELLHCPFCGGEIQVTVLGEEFYQSVLGTDYKCEPDYVLGHVDRMAAAKARCPFELVSYRSEVEAVNAWNTRAKRTCETCPQMDNPDSFIRHLIGCETCEKFYAVETWSDLDDWGETTIERKLYRTREEAERRAEEVEAWSSDEMNYGAIVVEFEVVE